MTPPIDTTPAALLALLRDVDSALQAHHLSSRMTVESCLEDGATCRSCAEHGGVELFRRLRDTRLALAAPTPPAPVDIEQKYRRILWLGHGCTAALYGDDGEMQCNDAGLHGYLDFKRDTLERLEDALATLKLQRIAKALAASPAPDHEALVERLTAALVTYPGKEKELLFVTIAADDARAILAALADAPVPPHVVVEVLERGTDEIMGRFQSMDQGLADKIEAGVKVDLDERYYTRQVVRGIKPMTPEHIRTLQAEGHSVLAHKYNDLAECPVCSTEKRFSLGQDWVSQVTRAGGEEVSVIGANVDAPVPPATLFQSGVFALHSGAASDFRINCDVLTGKDWQALAAVAVHNLPAFGSLEAVPSGGNGFAQALQQYLTRGPILIVDDVLTTGASMEAQRAGRDAIGVVAFARGPCPSWVTPLFQFAVPPATKGACERCHGSGFEADGVFVCAWCHGHGDASALSAPVPALRFFCPHCGESGHDVSAAEVAQVVCAAASERLASEALLPAVLPAPAVPVLREQAPKCPYPEMAAEGCPGPGPDQSRCLRFKRTYGASGCSVVTFVQSLPSEGT